MQTDTGRQRALQSAEYRRKRSRVMSQSNTFQHLGPSDSLTYNWVRHVTDTHEFESARSIAQRFSTVKENVSVLLAESPTTSDRTLEVLAFNHSPHVRQAVADNQRTPISALRILATDECLEVRYAVAENHNVPREILEILIEDDNPYVQQRAMETLGRMNS